MFPNFILFQSLLISQRSHTLMELYKDVILDQDMVINSTDRRGHLVTERGHQYEDHFGNVESLVAKIDGEQDHIRRESAPYPNYRLGYGTALKMNGETPHLETAETLKHTNDQLEQTNTMVEYDGQTAGESVRDFPQETCAATSQVILSGDNQSIFNTQPNTHHKTQTNSSIDHLQSAVNEKKRHMDSVTSSANDFVTENLKSIKTIKDLQAKRSAIRKQHQQAVISRQNSNPYGYKFMGLSDTKQRQSGSFQQFYRSQEWEKLILNNKHCEMRPMPHAGEKNKVTNKAFEDVPDIEASHSLNAALTGINLNMHERAYQTRNQSSINMLRSYRTVDHFADKDAEDDLIGARQAGVSLAQTLNRMSQLDQSTYGRQKVIPEEYITFKVSKEVIHNLNNREVQNARLRNYTSTFISDM